MVATVVRLKLTLLRNTLRRDRWRVVLLALGAVWALGAVPSVLGGALFLARQDVSVRHDMLVVVGTVLVTGWAVVPVLVFGSDDTLEPARFATFGVRVRRLVPGLLVASVLTVPALFTAVVCASAVVAWGSAGTAAAVVAAAGAVLALATCLLAARITTTAAARMLGSRRARELSAVTAAVVVTSALPLAFGIGGLGLEGTLERVPGIARVLGWTPLALAWAAPASAADGDTLGAVSRLALASAWVVLGAVAWGLLIRRRLVNPSEGSGRSRRQVDALLTGSRLGAASRERIAARAIGVRARRYWVTDPRFVTALVSLLVLPALITVLLATVVDVPGIVAIALGPLLGATLGWGRHNDLAFDGSAFWLHVVSGTTGRVDRWGRLLGLLGWGVPLVVAGSLAGVAVARRPDLLPATLGLALGLLAAGLAVSAVTSVALPYPVPAAGASPFASEAGAIGASMAAQLVASAATAVVALPVLVAFALAVAWQPAIGWVVLALGAGGGAVAVRAGVVLGGRVYDARAVRLLARLR
ncbi:hypothetical protein [Cellulomonas fimi]|uniref:ABC-2 type transport system permease protein n=1 Tax=Cellulomonas fimi TaxID=1708 RepID=A0A7Y0QHE9_CELFI|nr:hypothetical protein [Cellulomonas fimi]NMR21076.1 hypothetical protein [Cellulomonas fimi]